MIFNQHKVPPRSSAGGRPGSPRFTLFPPMDGLPGPASSAASARWSGSLFQLPSVIATTSDVCAGYVPSGLASLRQWIVWKWVQRRSGDSKVSVKLPISASTLRAASSTDPATWSTLRLAQAALATRAFTGLAFVFAQQGSLFGIDLDNCLSADGVVAPWAAEILAAFPTYAEVSPSGRGIKLWGIGEHHTKGLSAFMGTAAPGEKRSRIEVYGWGRTFAFTGRRLSSAPADVVDCRASLAALVKRLTVTPPPPLSCRRPLPTATTDSSRRAALYLDRVPPTKCGTASCHDRTFFCACRLVSFFRLHLGEAMPLLADWASRGEHRWSYRELEHKLSDAARKAGQE